MDTKFFTFDQNNIGGYFVKDAENGVCELVIIEAETANDAWKRLCEIGDNVDGFWDYCECCGERWWNSLDDSEGTSFPAHYDIHVKDAKASMFHNGCYVHYLNGTIERFDFKSA